MKVKVCGMREAQNIAEIARIQPDYMGFIFYERSPRFAAGLDPEALNVLSHATKRVGVFVDSPEKYIRDMAEKYKLDYLQLHGNESPELCRKLRAEYGAIKAFGIERVGDLEKTAAYEEACDYFLFDTKTAAHGGSGCKFDHHILSAYKGKTPYLLSGGLSVEDMALLATINDDRCMGFDINSRFEITSGIKDPVLVKRFIEAIHKIKKSTLQKILKMNRIDKLFAEKKNNVLSVYFTAGYPKYDDTVSIITELVAHGVDMIEIGIPFSDPMADGPVIQQSSSVALNNGMTLKSLFAQLKNIRSQVDIPLIMMGYLNPVMQYGIENFCRSCSETGIDGIIIPDLPFADYLKNFKPVLDKYGIYCIMLITPETSAERIRMIDEHTSGFIYMVSTASTTGAKDSFDNKTLDYFQKIDSMKLRNPRMIGFGISNKTTFDSAAQHAAGAIIGSSFIRLLGEKSCIRNAVEELMKILQNISYSYV